MVKGWYVHIVRAQRVARLAGPFGTRAEADAIKRRTLELAEKVDPWTWFDPHGVSRWPADKIGKLNHLLGLPTVLTTR